MTTSADLVQVTVTGLEAIFATTSTMIQCFSQMIVLAAADLTRYTDANETAIR